MLNLCDIYREILDTGAVIVNQAHDLPCGADASVIDFGYVLGVFFDIRQLRTLAAEKEAACHELCHIQTGATYTVGATPAVIQAAERRAYKAQIKKLLPFDEMRSAMQNGYISTYDLAEYFGVSEALVMDAIKYYRGDLGLDFN